MTPVASGRSVYETLILALRRNVKGVKVSKCRVSSYASCTYPHDFSICTSTDSLFPPTKVRLTPTRFFELFTYDYRHEGRSGDMT